MEAIDSSPVGKLEECSRVDANSAASSRALVVAKPLIREPLVHFLILGALLFLYFHWKGGAGPGSNRIVITPGEVEHLNAGFARTWQRPPTQEELKGLIDDFVKEEIATREAVAGGLDRNDTIIRRRLRQKLEFLADEAASNTPPTEAELQSWLDGHRDMFAGEPKLAFRQVYVSTSRHGVASRGIAETILRELRIGGADATSGRMGDATLLPAMQPLAPLSETTRTFGEAFAKQVVALPVREWSGPVESSFGLHLVLVEKKEEAAPPPLEEIRPQVEREVLQERKKAELNQLYESLLKKYTVSIELPKEMPGDSGAGAKAGQP